MASITGQCFGNTSADLASKVWVEMRAKTSSELRQVLPQKVGENRGLIENWPQLRGKSEEKVREDLPQKVGENSGTTKRALQYRATKENWPQIRAKTSLKLHQALPQRVGENRVEVLARHRTQETTSWEDI